MFPIRVKIKAGTLDIKEYNFEKNIFIGSNDKKYSIEDIEYFIVPAKEMKKMFKITAENSIESQIIKAERKPRTYSK